MPIRFPYAQSASRTLRISGYLAILFLVAVVYELAGRVGLWLAPSQQVVSPVWPPAGIGLAALLLFGYRVWPSIFIGALVIDLWSGKLTLLPSVLIAMGCTLGAVTSVHILRRKVGTRFPLERSRDLVAFVIAAISGSMISAFIGTASLSVTHQKTWATIPDLWFTWWMADTSGVLLVTPFVLSWLTIPRQWGVKRYGSLFGFVLVSLLLTLFFFGEVVIGPLSFSRDSSFSFLVTPILIWGALSFGVRGASTAALFI